MLLFVHIANVVMNCVHIMILVLCHTLPFVSQWRQSKDGWICHGNRHILGSTQLTGWSSGLSCVEVSGKLLIPCCL